MKMDKRDLNAIRDKWVTSIVSNFVQIFAIAIVLMAIERLSFVWSHPNEQLSRTKFANILETGGFNLLGDTLSGVIASITLFVVVKSFFFQKEQMDATVAEMKHQNEIALEVAKANYKFQLFDKRLAVYDELNALIMQNATGNFEEDFHPRFIRASIAARNIFGDQEITNWIGPITTTVTKIKVLEAVVERMEKDKEDGLEWEYGRSTLLVESEKLAKERKKLNTDLDWNELDRLFLPYIQLPPDIIIPERTKA